jgi:phospholipid-transporting ATPase
VVKLLSALFTQFDNLTTKHAVYKIQTIGDAYVIVSGFPFCTPRNPDADAASSADATDAGAAGSSSPEDSPAACALRMMHMAFDMISVIESVRTAEGGRVRMRIGVHTGRLIAGCIGTKTLRYDIWGTDCLCSNTLESSGRPSCVVLSEATKVLVQDRLIQDRIECVPFEVVNVKGMGDVQTYIVPVTSEAREEFLQYQSERSAGGAAAISAAHGH